MNTDVSLRGTEGVKISPREVFLHLLGLVALYVSAASFITLLFQYVNALVPDPLAYDYGYGYQLYRGPLRFAISSLLIIFPAFIGVSYLLERGYREVPSRREGRLKRWLTYFTLFAAALIIVGDLVVLVYNFLGGELTLRFVLKSASFLLVAGTVFSYYLKEVRRLQPPSKTFVWSVSAVVAVATIGSFFLIGSPFAARERAFDERRVTDLQNIQQQVVEYWRLKQQLPATLDDLVDSIRDQGVPVDPNTRAGWPPYEYQATGAKTFELCATFLTDSEPV